MDVEQARKELDAIRREIHDLLESWEAKSGLEVIAIDLERGDAATLYDPFARRLLARVRIRSGIETP